MTPLDNSAPSAILAHNMNLERDNAREYFDRVGYETAKKSNHYLTAKRHCKCQQCFCCAVKEIVDEYEERFAGKIYE
jgi:hypothetical protein